MMYMDKRLTVLTVPIVLCLGFTGCESPDEFYLDTSGNDEAIVESAITACIAPASPTASEIGLESARLSWADVDAANYFKLRYRRAGTSRWTTRNYLQDTAHTVTGLQPDTTYQFKVRSYCGWSRSSWSNTVSFSTPDPNAPQTCQVPEGLYPFGIGSLQATLTWQSVSGADSYTSRYRVVGTVDWSEVTVAQTNLVVVRDLNEATEYEFQVRASCSGRSSGFSSSHVFTTATNVCLPPNQVEAVSTTESSATIDWDETGGANRYILRYREVDGNEWQTRNATAPTFTLTDLIPNTTYELAIGVDCTLGPTDYSNPIQFTTDQITACETPTSLYASQVSETFATQSWDTVTGAIEYTIRRRNAGDTGWSFEHRTADTSITTYALEPDTTYEFQVQAHCEIGDSGFSSSSQFTTLPVGECPAPEQLSSSDITDSSAFLNWEDILEANSFTIQYRVSGVSAWNSADRLFSSYNIDGLSPDTSYEWRIRSNCEANASSFSSIETFNTLSAGTCPTPTGLFVMGLGANQATLIWSTVSGALVYDVRYRETQSTTWTEQTVGGTNLLVIQNLASLTEHEFQVRSDCGPELSPYSGSYHFATR